MKGVVYNTINSRFSIQFESIALRTGYLLCDYLAVAGNNIEDLLMEEKDYKNLPMKQKIAMLEKFDTDNKEWQETLQSSKQYLKGFPHIKNKTPKILGAYKKMEHSLMVIYEGMVANILNHRKTAGIEALINLIDGNTFGIYHENCKDPEIDEPHKNSVSASNLLKLVLPDKDKSEYPSLFILTGDFTHPEFAKDFIIYTADDPDAGTEQNVCMEACFTIPNINALLQTELTMLRRQLSGATESFRKAADQWLHICYSEQSHAAAAISFMQQKMVPAMHELKSNFEQNEMLQNFGHLYKNAAHLEVNLALVPVEIIWKYYNHFGALTEKTWQVLQDALETNDKYKKRWPAIIVCRSGWEEKPGEEPASDDLTEFPVTVKKHISVD